jgi:hypothetical protein
MIDGGKYMDNEEIKISVMKEISKQLNRLNDNMEKMLKIVTSMKDELYGK